MDMKIKARLAILREYLTLIGFKDIEIRVYSPTHKKGTPIEEVHIRDIKNGTGKFCPEPFLRITAFHNVLGNTMELSHMLPTSRSLSYMTDEEVSEIIKHVIEQSRYKITEDLHRQAFNRATLPARDFF